jgi:hypothetical protein
MGVVYKDSFNNEYNMQNLEYAALARNARDG